jgi:hypothetical protein
MIGATQKVDIHHLRRTGEVRILVAVLDIKKIPKFADVCVKGCMYRLYFKPDEEVSVTPDFTRKTECISYVRQDQFTHT